MDAGIEPVRLDQSTWSPGRFCSGAVELSAGACVDPEGASAGIYRSRFNRPVCARRYRVRATAGVAVELKVVPGAFHAFDGIAPDASLSRPFALAWREALRRAFTQAA
jgi:hypothetical protein